MLDIYFRVVCYDTVFEYSACYGSHVGMLLIVSSLADNTFLVYLSVNSKARETVKGVPEQVFMFLVNNGFMVGAAYHVSPNYPPAYIDGVRENIVHRSVSVCTLLGRVFVSSSG